MIKRFKKLREDFSCDQCGYFVRGNGYTNHCPKCLWSKHVDVYPGDRAALCGGAMEPRAVETHGGEYRIIHRCVICGYEKPNKVVASDNMEQLAAYAARFAEKGRP